jgi:hypothetical protein
MTSGGEQEGWEDGIGTTAWQSKVMQQHGRVAWWSCRLTFYSWVKTPSKIKHTKLLTESLVKILILSTTIVCQC